MLSMRRYGGRRFSTKPPQENNSWNDYISNRLNSLSQTVNEAPTTKDIHELFKEMEKRRYNTRKIKWIAGAVGISMVVLSAKQIKGFLSSQGAEVTTQSMDDPEFQKKVQELSTQVSHQVLHDLMDNQEMQIRLKGYTRDVLKDAVVELYKDPDFQKETRQMVGEVVTSKLIEDKSSILAKQVALNLINDEDIHRKTGQLISSGAYYAIMPRYIAGNQKNN